MLEAPKSSLIGNRYSNKGFLLIAGIFALIAYFPLFLHLGSDPIYAWDESMFAMRAYQLANSGTFLENFGDYVAGFNNPNIKPPFGTYFQALSFKIFGYNELALRLPVALFCLSTGILLIWFFYRYFYNPLLGFLSAMVLVCSPGYITPHLARTGDHEGILIFLALAALLSFYQYTENKQPKWIYLSAMFFAFGFLTKNLVVLFPLPAMLLYLVYQKQLLTFIKSKAVWQSAALFLVILGINYFIVWRVSPYNFRFLGFGNVQDRFVNVVHGHAAPLSYYWTELGTVNFFPWVWLLPVGLTALALNKNSRYRSFMLLMLASSISHLMVITISKTKLPWYDASVYPWLSVIAAFGLWAIWEQFLSQFSLSAKARLGSISLLTMAVFGYSYTQEVAENMKRLIYSPQQKVGLLLMDVRDHHPELKTITVIDDNNKGNLVASFYISSMNDHYGYDIKWQNHYRNIEVGDTLGLCTTQLIQWADSLYSQKTLKDRDGCKIVVLTDTIKTNHTTQH
jgi:4-amino-4-deoxy-L-arabinose transferase-like glycosyltransferase